MAKLYVAIIGHTATGKESSYISAKEKFARELTVSIHHFSDPLSETLDLLCLEKSRPNQQLISTILRQAFGENLLGNIIFKRASANTADIVFLDGVRRPKDVEMLRELPNSYLGYVWAPSEEAYKRLVKRNDRPGDAEKTWEQFQAEQAAEAESLIDTLRPLADFELDNSSDDPNFTLLRIQVVDLINRKLGLTKGGSLMLSKYPGNLILLEGCEGAGKSTLVRSLGEILRNKVCDVVETKEPRGRARDILLNPNHPLTPQEELTIFIDGRAEHFSEIVIPALIRGDIVLCDRSSPSTIAYQHHGRGIDLTDILVRDARARQNVGFDLVILLDIDPEVGLKRKKPETRFELEAIDFHRKVRDGYLEQAKDDLNGKWVIIDATKNADNILSEALVAVFKLLSKKMREER